MSRCTAECYQLAQESKMQCKAVMSAVLVLLLLLLREGTGGRPQRTKRRVPPRLDRPLSLEELKFEVCGLNFVYTGITL